STPPSTVSRCCRNGMSCSWWVSTLVDTMNMATTETGFCRVEPCSTALLDCFGMGTLDASADNGEDGGWFFWLALHGATHP
ncbi:TPA: hypothetical protein ACXM54_004012, partial [Stenotrophomonas maltophilia]